MSTIKQKQLFDLNSFLLPTSSVQKKKKKKKHQIIIKDKQNIRGEEIKT